MKHGLAAHMTTVARTGITVLVAVVAFVTALDNTVITVALPSIAADLRLGPGESEWLGLGYMLPFSGLLLVAGAAVDRWGQRRLLLLGLTVFGLAAAAGGAASAAGWLILARAVQGAAAALILPATLSAIRTGLPERRRDTAAAVWTAAIAVALALGPLLGGALTQYLRWNWVLWINIPFALLGLALARTVPEHRETRSKSGILLRDRVFLGSLVIQLLWGLGVSGIFFFTPSFLQDSVGLRPAASGLPLLAVAAAVAVATPFVAGAVRRFGVGRAVAAGLFAVAAGLCAVALPGTHPPVPALLPGLVAIGLGSAFSTPLAATTLNSAGPEQAGIASGLLSTDRELASALGVALIGAVVHGPGYPAGLLVAAGLQVTAGILALWLLRKPGA